MNACGCKYEKAEDVDTPVRDEILPFGFLDKVTKTFVMAISIDEALNYNLSGHSLREELEARTVFKKGGPSQVSRLKDLADEINATMESEIEIDTGKSFFGITVRYIPK